jgi:hypothetical protein
MPLAPPENRIYALIEKAIDTSDPEELEVVMKELRAALKEHIELTKSLAVSTLSSLLPKEPTQLR